MKSWFDDFVEMKIILGTDDEEEVDEELIAEQREQLANLRIELAHLQDELGYMEPDEPEDVESDSYSRWEARRDLLEEQIADVESEIEDLEAELES